MEKDEDKASWDPYQASKLQGSPSETSHLSLPWPRPYDVIQLPTGDRVAPTIALPVQQPPLQPPSATTTYAYGSLRVRLRRRRLSHSPKPLQSVTLVADPDSELETERSAIQFPHPRQQKLPSANNGGRR